MPDKERSISKMSIWAYFAAHAPIQPISYDATQEELEAVAEAAARYASCMTEVYDLDIDS